MSDFWRRMREAAELSRRSPDWAKAGINLNPRHFETYAPTGGETKEYGQ